MRTLKIQGNPVSEEGPELKILIAEARSKQLSAVEESALLEKIRRGNSRPIDKLVDSREVIILSIIQQYAFTKDKSIAEMMEAGKKALYRLAESEIGSTSRERFFRFDGWVIRQSILEGCRKI